MPLHLGYTRPASLSIIQRLESTALKYAIFQNIKKFNIFVQLLVCLESSNTVTKNGMYYDLPTHFNQYLEEVLICNSVNVDVESGQQKTYVI